MAYHKTAFLLLILLLIPFLSACGADGTQPSISTGTPAPSTPATALSSPTLLYFWAQW